MNYNAYPYETNETGLHFQFFSEGPKGKIEKAIHYTLRYSKAGSIFFNLAFGDWKSDENKIDDSSVTNNNDRDRILATIAETIIAFTNIYSRSPIYIEGSTPSRTRLFRMNINKHKHEIDKLFEIYGLNKITGWEIFKSEKNYQSFLILRKKNNFIKEK